MPKKKQPTTQNRQRRKTTKTRQSHPHDSLFKQVFKRPEFCRALMQVLLTPSFYALFDWASVKISESVATGAKGEEHRADIVLEVPLSNSKFQVIMTIITEHKSYRDNNTIVQVLGYYNAIAQATGSIILPVIVLCSEDKQASIPSDYISWALQKQGAPEKLRKHFKKLPNFHSLLVNLHDLSYQRMRRGGKAVHLALFGMRNFWDIDEDIIAQTLKKARLLPQEEREFVLNVLIDYYECADERYGREGFAKVERKKFPNLKEEDRIMPEMLFGLDRAKEEGKQQGIEQGKLEKLEMIKRFLLEGIDERIICKATKLSKQELDKIKSGM